MVATSLAAPSTWVGSNGAWTTAANWSPVGVPAAGDTVNIANGSTVNTNGIGDYEYTPANLTVNLSGNSTLTNNGLVRLQGGTWNVGSGCTLSGGYYAMYSANLNFANGAVASFSDWEGGGCNTKFTLGSTGFTTITPGVFRASGASWTADMAAYTGGNATIKLIRFNTDLVGMTDATFQTAALSVINKGTLYTDSSLHWNSSDNSVELRVVRVPELWTGSGGDGSWTNANNWGSNIRPGAFSSVVIGSNASVTGVDNVFTSLTVASGASVSFGVDTVSGGKTLDISGTLDRAGVFHLVGSTLKLSGSLGSSITWLDTNGSTLNFSNGAAFANPNMSFEHKGSNTFGYTLSASGFSTLTAGALHSGNNGSFSATWANATYNIDVSAYNISNGNTIVLAQYASHDAVFDGTFNPTVNIIAGSSGHSGILTFDKVLSRLVLTVNDPVTITTPGLSIRFDGAGVVTSLKNAAVAELLTANAGGGFYLVGPDGSNRQFNTITALGGGVYRFKIAGSTEMLTARFAGTNDYMTVRFTSLSGFALQGEVIRFRLNQPGTAVKTLPLDYMVGAGNYGWVLDVSRDSLWETQTLGSFAIYQNVSPAQEDETLLDLWTMEGLPHPKVAGPWNRAAAQAWLTNWTNVAYDTSYLNIEPNSLAEHSAFIPYASAMNAKWIYLWNLIWRGEYWLQNRQNDEINPAMYPSGLADMQAFRKELATSGKSLGFHYLCGNIGEEDPQFTRPVVSPDLQSWGNVTLTGNISSSDTSMTVQPAAGVKLPIISASFIAPPQIPSFFDFKTFRIGNEWVNASSVTDLGNGTWQLAGVSRGQWDTNPVAYPSGTSLRGYMRPYNQDFVPDPNSPLFTTIATRWANLNNTLGIACATFDGFENHAATGSWGAGKFAAAVYQNLDHPTVSGTSGGVPPDAWLEYHFNRVKDALGGPIPEFGFGGSLYLGDKSQTTPSVEELEVEMNGCVNANSRSFCLGNHDVTGIPLSTLTNYGLTAKWLDLLKDWKDTSFSMSATQRAAMNTSQGADGTAGSLGGAHGWAANVWRLEGSQIRKWYSLGTTDCIHEWYGVGEIGIITPRFYVKNGDTQALEVPAALGPVTSQTKTRIVGRVLPSFPANAVGNVNLIPLMSPGNSTLTVARTNSTSTGDWSEANLITYPLSQALNLNSKRGIRVALSGISGSGTLVVRLNNGASRDYVLPIKAGSPASQTIDIPTCEQAWRMKDWGRTLGSGISMDYQNVTSVSIGIGHLAAGTACSMQVTGLTALSETANALVNPIITLGGQSIQIGTTGSPMSISTESHFVLDQDGLFTVYDELWKKVVSQRFGTGLVPVNLSTFSINSSSSSADIWLEVGVQVSNGTAINPAPHAPVTWLGPDGNWVASSNWSPAVPVASDTVTIDNGSTVDTTGIDGPGGNQLTPSNLTLNLSGNSTLTNSGLVRLNGGAWNVASGSALTGGYYAMYNANLNFANGAVASFSDWEGNGCSTKFTLGSTGFTTLRPTNLRNATGASWTVDVAAYTGGNATIKLMRFTTDLVGMTDAIFQTASLNVINKGAYSGSSLHWNPSDNSIELRVMTKAWAVTTGTWGTSANWSPAGLPASGETINIANGGTVDGHDADLYGNLPSNLTLNLSGNSTLTAGAGTIRVLGSTLNVASGSALTGYWWEIGNDTINFANGSVATMSNWQDDGSNIYKYTLGTTGFTTLTPGKYYGNATSIASNSYTVDMAAYTGGSAVIKLVSFGSLGAGPITDAIFQGAKALYVINKGSIYIDSTLHWNSSDNSIELWVINSQYKTWIGASGTWVTSSYWSSGTLPVAGNILTIANGSTVNTTGIGSYEYTPANLTVNLSGNSTLTDNGLVRFYGGTWNVASGSALTGGYHAMYNANLNFANGAVATFSDWEGGGCNTKFTLGSTGFATLTPGVFRASGTSWTADMAAYTGGNANIKLIRFSYDAVGMTDAIFQTASLNVINKGAYPDAALHWNSNDNSIELRLVNGPKTWIGGGGNNLWINAANWNPAGVPVAGETVNISNGSTVDTTGIGAYDYTPGNFTVNLSGNSTLTNTTGIRLNATTLNVASGSTLTGGFFANYGATINFANGAVMTTADFEDQGLGSIWNFTLGSAGFSTLHPGTAYIGNTSRWSVDMAAYTGGNATIKLVTFSYNGNGMTDAIFQTSTALNVINKGAYPGSTLHWNPNDNSIELRVSNNPAPVAANQSIGTPVNTLTALVLGAIDPDGHTLTYTVVASPTHGTLTGTAPNLTYTPNVSFIGTDYLTFTASNGSFVSNLGTVSITTTPQTATQLWQAYQSKIVNDPVNPQVLLTTTQGGITIKQIRYDLGQLVGTQVTASPKIAAYFAYPTAGSNLPGIVAIHGGGQRASVGDATYWALQGYACISINWGGLPMTDLPGGDVLPNTDWNGLAAGFSRQGVTYATHREPLDPETFPDGATLFDVLHPLNNSYMLNSYAARRALTFLTSQSNVNSNKLGVTGHSMGGQTTVFTATDPRITCVTPSVGGSGYLYEDFWGLPGTARVQTTADLPWYKRVASPESYWPVIQCPTLFLEASNDHNAPFDFVAKGMALQPSNVPQRLAVAPHFDHVFDSKSEAARILWQKTWLTNSFTFPATAAAQLDLTKPDGIPLFTVTPDTSTSNTIVSVDIYYGSDRDPLTRFWQDAQAVAVNGHWEAKCPVFDNNEPLFAFAIVTYDCGFDVAMPAGYTSPTRQFSVASQVRTVYPPTLVSNGIHATQTQQWRIDDFARGYHDWYTYSPTDPTYFQFWTRKPNDPAWTGPVGSKLALGTNTTGSGNKIGIKILVGWQGTDADTYIAIVPVTANGDTGVPIALSSFINVSTGAALTSWNQVKLVGVMPGKLAKPSDTTLPAWAGSVPVLSNLRWVGGPPDTLTYSPGSATYTKGTAIASNNPGQIGGTVVSYSVSPALPTGLSLNTSTGVISGTPTAITPTAAYTVTATNSYGSATASLTLAVNNVTPSALTYSTNPAIYAIGIPITSNTPSNSGGAVVSYSVSPALPAGLSLNTGSGMISGTPTAITSLAAYTMTATNSGGSTTASLTLTVNAVASTFSATGTWICPANVKFVQVQSWGGGGAGGSAKRSSSGSTQYGGGGAGGAYAKKNSYQVTPGATYYINVGTGGSNSSGTNGTTAAGLNSWINSVNSEPSGAGNCLAKGGAGGASAVGSGTSTQFGAGGTGTATGSIGDIIYAGGSGATTTSTTNGYAGAGGGSGGTAIIGISGTANSGTGATAVTGGGNGGNSGSSSGSGPGVTPATAPGGGGGGAKSASNTLQNGGTGAVGQVLLTALSSNADLSNLALSTGTLSPTFDSATLSYTASVSNLTSSITVTPTVSSSSATVKVNDGTVASGSASGAINLTVGTNTVTTVVTAQDGTTTKTYAITVTRQIALPAGGSDLLRFAFGMTLAGASGVLVYTGTFAGNGAIISTGMPTAVWENVTGGVDYRALFVRRTDYRALELTYTVQFSANLSTWSESLTEPQILADDGINQIVSVPYPPFLAGEKAYFFRISVSGPP